MILNDKCFSRALRRPRLVVMFTAKWAGPCNLVRDRAEAVAREHPDTVLAEFDVDDNPATPERYGVRALPTFILFRNGLPAVVKAGAISDASLTVLFDPMAEEASAPKPRRKKKPKEDIQGGEHA